MEKEIKSYKLFLDDLRDPPDDTWVVVRNYSEFVDTITRMGIPKTVSFDHDLADFDVKGKGIVLAKWEEKTGMDCAKWLVDNDIVLPHYTVHSANPVGAKNIRSLLDNFARFKEREDT